MRTTFTIGKGSDTKNTKVRSELARNQKLAKSSCNQSSLKRLAVFVDFFVKKHAHEMDREVVVR